MAVGFYDQDILEKPNKVLINLELMKIANYYNSLGQSVSLIQDVSKADNFEKIYSFRNISFDISRKKIKDVDHDNVEHYGLAYHGNKYIPMSLEFEQQKPYVQIYAPYFKDQLYNQKLTVPQLQKMMDCHYLRLRAGDYQMPLDNLNKKSKLFIYDREIELVEDWEEKLKYIRQNLVPSNSQFKTQVPNGFYFTSFENVEKLLLISSYVSRDVWLNTQETYDQFRSNFNQIQHLTSSRDGMKYYFGSSISPNDNNLVMRELCLIMNKYFYAKSIGKSLSPIADENLAESPLWKICKEFENWCLLRVKNDSFKDYLDRRIRKEADRDFYFNMINKTIYRKRFNSLLGATKNMVKETGWYYHE